MGGIGISCQKGGMAGLMGKKDWKAGFENPIVDSLNMLNKNNLFKLNKLMSYHGNKRNLRWHTKIHTRRNNWRLKWFQVNLKRCILDGRREKP